MNFTSWLTRRRQKKKDAPIAGQRSWDLSAGLLHLTAQDAWSIRDAVEGTLILGATGSGKSSGSGRALALAMLKAGFGGLVLTVKPDERAQWEGYLREAKRPPEDLVVFSPEQPHRFNFLNYEMMRKGVGGGITENLVNLFSTVLEVAERNTGGGGGREDEGYWKRALRQLLRNSVDLLALAKGQVTIPDLYRVVISAPTSLEQLRSEEWKAKSACFRWLSEADKLPKSARQRADFEIVADYWLVEFPALSDKTRSVIVSTFTSMVDVLNRGVLAELFSGETNLTPEAVQDGKIILIDLPVKEYNEVGVFAQVLWKTCFQRSIERRTPGAGGPAGNPRPVFLWADEAQYFLTSLDAQFQTTCRSARVATVMLTQNISNFYAALGGGPKAEAEANSLFANLNTKIFHAQADPVTNEWAAVQIGRARQLMATGSMTYAPEDTALSMLGLGAFAGSSPSVTSGFNESWDWEVQPAAFTRLRTGGLCNRWCVDGIVFQNGRVYRSNRRAWLPVTFQQRGG